MKKLLILILTVAVLISAFAFPSNATTKADLLAMVKTSPIYHYFAATIENLYNTIEVTDEQATALAPYVEAFLATVTDEDIAKIENLIDSGIFPNEKLASKVVGLATDVCSSLGWTISKVDDGGGDLTWCIYDDTGDLVMTYGEGQLPVDTSIDNSDSTAFIYISCGIGVTALAAVLFFALKKKSEENE